MTEEITILPMKNYDISGNYVKKKVKERKYYIFGDFVERERDVPAPDGKIDSFEFKAALFSIARSSRMVYGKNPKYASMDEQIKLAQLIDDYMNYVFKQKININNEEDFKKEILEALDYLQAKMQSKNVNAYY